MAFAGARFTSGIGSWLARLRCRLAFVVVSVTAAGGDSIPMVFGAAPRPLGARAGGGRDSPGIGVAGWRGAGAGGAPFERCGSGS